MSLLLENNYILEPLSVVRFLRLTFKYLPELKRNLISLGESDENYDIRIHKSFIKLTLDHKEVISSPKINGIYTLQAKPLVGYSSAAVNL